MGQIWPMMTQDDWLWPRMTPGGPGGRQGAPGGSRLPPAPKRVIKQLNNDSNPWFKVPKVRPDPKGMAFTHFWCIWGHLDALQQRYLVKTQYCQKPGSRKKFILRFTQPTWCNISKFLQFSTPRGIPRRCGKLRKLQNIAPGGLCKS